MTLFWSFLPQRFPDGCMCLTLTPLWLFKDTSCGCWCCLFSLLMSWAVHCTLVLKLCGLQQRMLGGVGYTTGMAGEMAVWRGCAGNICFCHSMEDLYLFFCSFVCFPAPSPSPSSPLPWSRWVTVFWPVVVFYGKAVVLPPSYFSLWKYMLAGFRKRLLYVAWMDHGAHVGCSSLFLLTSHGCLWLAVLLFNLFWWVIGLMHDWAFSRG